MADTVPILYQGRTLRADLVVVVGANLGAQTVAADLDTDGNVVPTYKAHTLTYDGSGNLSTDTVTDGVNTWVRTYMWTNGAQTSDSGWVKQNA